MLAESVRHLTGLINRQFQFPFATRNIRCPKAPTTKAKNILYKKAPPPLKLNRNIYAQPFIGHPVLFQLAVGRRVASSAMPWLQLFIGSLSFITITGLIDLVAVIVLRICLAMCCTRDIGRSSASREFAGN
jgi:hypothetical protein